MDDIGARVLDFLTETEQKQFAVYYRLLLEWNEKVNLTAIVEPQEVYVKHFWDSLSAMRTDAWKLCSRSGAKVVDIGTGAGFPGIPLAICHPQVEFVLLDSLNKRLVFLREVIAALGLQNVELVHSRAEDAGRDKRFRGQFDAVMARAVARLNTLLELMAPFAAVGGKLFAYKGPAVEEEVADSARAAGQLGVSIAKTYAFDLPLAMGSRTLIVAEQMRTVPQAFPRKAGTPQRKPL